MHRFPVFFAEKNVSRRFSSMNYESDKSSKNSRICVVRYKSLHSAPCGGGCKDEDDYQSDQNILNVIVTYQASDVLGGS